MGVGGGGSCPEGIIQGQLSRGLSWGQLSRGGLSLNHLERAMVNFELFLESKFYNLDSLRSHLGSRDTRFY